MTVRKSLWATAIALLALMCAHAADVSSREALLREFMADPIRATPRIAERYGIAAAQCGEEGTDSLYPLAAAFLTVETMATTRLEGWARAGLVTAAAAIGMAPDISVGPGRIRPRTAQAALQHMAPDAAGRLRDLSGAALAKTLLRPCDALRVAVAILEDIRRRTGAQRGDIDRKFISSAAAIYNGQDAATDSVEAKLAAKLYLELVYDAYLHYRFRSAATLPHVEAAVQR